MDIKMYITKNGSTIIGKYNKDLDCLEDTLQVKVINYVEPNSGQKTKDIIAIPLGYPINLKEQTITLDKLDIMFESTDNLEHYKKIYEEDLEKVQNPGILKPKAKILH